MSRITTVMLRQFAALARGEPASPVQSTFELARGHLIAVNGASEAASVHTVPQQHIDIVPNDDGSTLAALRGIESAFDTCARTGRMLHESGLLNWTSKGGKRDLRGYDHFAGPAPA